MKSLPQIEARFNPKAVLIGAGPPSAGYFALAAIPARYALERQDWQQAERLSLRETPFPYTEAMTWFARGLGAAHLRHAAAANEAAEGAAESKTQERLLNASAPYGARQVEIQQVAVAAWSALAAGRNEEALQRMQAAADLEDGTEKSAVTHWAAVPGAQELLGQMLLQMK